MDTVIDLSKKITFLLPLKGRESITQRVIKYLNDINYKLKILVADGSLQTQENLFLRLKEKHHIILHKFRMTLEFKINNTIITCS